MVVKDLLLADNQKKKKKKKMFGAVKPGFRSLALKLVMNVVGEL